MEPITKLSDISYKGRSVKNIVQHHINFAKAKRTPRERDQVAIHLIKVLTKKIESQQVRMAECKEMVMQWHRYIEYSGEHELHDMYSLELNIYAILISGLTGMELLSQVRRVCRQVETLEWDRWSLSPMEYFRNLLSGEEDGRVFTVDFLHHENGVCMTANKKLDKELMKQK